MISCEDGETESMPLLNMACISPTTGYSLSLSIIDSVATDTEQVLFYKADHGTKKYQLRLFSYHPKQPTKRIAYVDFRLKNTDYVPMLAAVTAQGRIEPENRDCVIPLCGKTNSGDRHATGTRFFLP